MNLRLLLAAFVTFAAAVRAQPPPPPEVPLRFIFLDETPGAYRLRTGDNTYRRLSAAPYTVSPPVLAKPSERLAICKDDLVPDPRSGRKLRAQIASVVAPASAALVVVTPRPLPPDPSQTPAYDVRLIPDDPAAFVPGTVRLLNLDSVPMAASLGGAPVIVPPGAIRIVHPLTDSRHRVQSRVAIQTPAGWHPVSSPLLVVRPDERLTGVLVYSESGLRYTYTAAEIAENGPPPPGHFWLSYAERD